MSIHDTNEYKISCAINNARGWLELDPGENDDLTEAIENECAAFDEAIENDDLASALEACNRLSREWASSDTSGFSELKSIVKLIGTDVETDDGNGRILDITPTTVTVAWDGEIKTTESVERLADWGIEVG